MIYRMKEKDIMFKLIKCLQSCFLSLNHRPDLHDQTIQYSYGDDKLEGIHNFVCSCVVDSPMRWGARPFTSSAKTFSCKHSHHLSHVVPVITFIINFFNSDIWEGFQVHPPLFHMVLLYSHRLLICILLQTWIYYK